MLNIVCVDSGNYEGRGAEYVTILHDMVARNLPEGFPGKFICFSDYRNDYGPGIEVRELPGHLKGWWNKLYLFKCGLFPSGDRILFFDLDTVITGKLDDLAAYDGPLALLRDFYRPDGFQSSVMAWEAGYNTDIWSLYADESYPDIRGGDQAWIEDFEPVALQDKFPGMFVSYKAHNCREAPKKDASVIVFHGRPRPHQCKRNWVPYVWKVGGGTAAMLESVCNTAAETIRSNVKAAIARGLARLLAQPEHDRVAYIVGGSPSLPENIQNIPPRADVFGLNAAATFLLDNGIRCNQVILDARPEMADLIERRCARFFIASQCDPSVFDIAPSISTTMFHSMDIGLGSTVGLQAMAIAYLLGYRKIHLIGMDSSYRDDAGHAYTQRLNDGDKRIDVIVADQKFTAAPWMAQQAEEFKTVAHILARAGCELTVHGDGLIPAIAHQIARQQALAEAIQAPEEQAAA